MAACVYYRPIRYYNLTCAEKHDFIARNRTENSELKEPMKADKHKKQKTRQVEINRTSVYGLPT